MSNLQAPRATLVDGREWSACVLGAAGEVYGLALYTSAADLFGSMTCETPEEAFDAMRGRMVSVTFQSLKSVPSAARKELARGGWRMAGPTAYPDLMTSNTAGGGVSRADARDLVALLRAIPRFVGAHAAALAEEERTGVPCAPIAWADPESGAVLRYAGEATEAAFEDEWQDDDWLDDEDPIRRAIAAAVEQVGREAGPDATADDVLARVNELLRDSMGELNAAPQRELGGLSPAQVYGLMEPEWDGTGVVRLRRDLPAPALVGVPVLERVRRLLELAEELGGLGRTQAGYLKVAVVREAAARAGVGVPGGLHASGPGTGRTRELDVWPVHEARTLAELAELLRPRRARFELTRAGREMLQASRAGELFALLFDTCFRRFNIFYGGYFEWPELQHQIAFTLWRLGDAAAEWSRPADLMHDVVLPFALEHAPGEPTALGPDRLLDRYVLRRLEDFGLLERRETGRRPDREYRAAPLLRQFLHFDLSRARPTW